MNGTLFLTNGGYIRPCVNVVRYNGRVKTGYVIPEIIWGSESFEDLLISTECLCHQVGRRGSSDGRDHIYGINLFGRGRDRGVDFLNGEWCRLKIQIVHLKESCSVIGEFGTMMGVTPVNIA